MGLYWVYLVYGLSFVLLAWALLVEQTHNTPWIDRETLPWGALVLFALLHGAHEWLWFGVTLTEKRLFWEPLRLALLALSFLALAVFAVEGAPARWRRYLRGGGGLLLAALAVAWYLVEDLRDAPLQMDRLLRSALGAPVSVLAAWTMVHLARQAQTAAQRQGWRAAAGVMACYGLSQWGGQGALATGGRWDGFPWELVRAGLAFGLLVALLWVVRDRARVRQARYHAAQAARLEALERAQAAQEAQERLQRELVRRIVASQEEERHRIARELHDETAQLLTAFRLNLAALRQRLPQDEAALTLLRTLDQLSDAMALRLHHLVHRLRPAQLDDLGLAPALEVLVEESRQTLGLTVHLHIVGPRRRLPPMVETVAYRLVQEALTNVARHAGVREAEVEVRFAEEGLLLQVRDRGVGFRVPPEQEESWRLGLAGMRERVAQVGGTLRIHSQPNQGTCLEAWLPACQVASPDLENTLGGRAP